MQALDVASSLVLCGDCEELLKGIPDNSFDSGVTDPPYGLKFMGKKWDYSIPGVGVWQEVLRTLKPGGHLLCFGGSRTFHRMTCNIEDAGFEIRDTILWLYGQGFPKSMDVSKAIDKAAGATREVGPVDPARAGRLVNQSGDYSTDAGWSAGNRKVTIDPPATPEAAQWSGWGTALKPAFEPIIVARKPLEGTVAANVLKYGTGAMNIDACRVEGEKPSVANRPFEAWRNMEGRDDRQSPPQTYDPTQGRWPANVMHDGSEEVLAAFPDAPGQSAARFFYCSKTGKKDRGEGNKHPTVKPTALMQYLCRLVTPPGGLILDPFCGSGSTGVAALREGFRSCGMDLSQDYCELSQRRIADA